VKKLVIAVVLVATFVTGSALADYVYRDANNALQTFFAFTCQVTKNCSAQVLIDSTGTEKATVGNPLRTAEANSTALLAAVQLGSHWQQYHRRGYGGRQCDADQLLGTITAGGTAQVAITASCDLARLYHRQHRRHGERGEPLWISFTGTAAAAATRSYPLSAPTATSFAGLSSYTTPNGFGTNANVSVIGSYDRPPILVA
jgi:hypothetical protein